MTTIFTNDRKVVAWVCGMDLPRVHALLDEAIYALPQPFARLTKPIEEIANPGVIVGWGVVVAAPSTYAPSLPAVVEMVIGQSDADAGVLSEQSQWRKKDGQHIGWAVTEAKIGGPWQQFTTPEAALAEHGYRWLALPDVDAPDFEQVIEDMEASRAAQSGTYELTAAEMVQLDVLLETFYGMAQVTLNDMLGAHRLGLGRARLMQRLAAQEAATE